MSVFKPHESHSIIDAESEKGEKPNECTKRYKSQCHCPGREEISLFSLGHCESTNVTVCGPRGM